MWMVQPWLAMGQEYNENVFLVHAPYIIHLAHFMEGAWCVIGCMFDLGMDFGACDFNMEHSGEKGLTTPSVQVMVTKMP